MSVKTNKIMPQPKVQSLHIQKIQGQVSTHKTDLIVVEEPLEIRLGYGQLEDRKQKSISLTMRTPGNDFELSLGFLFTEGVIQHKGQIHKVRYCEHIKDQESSENIVRVELSAGVQVDLTALQRNFYTNSSCGVCGKASLESLETLNCPAPLPSSPKVLLENIHQLAEVISKEQTVFKYTGGLHAAAIFSDKGELALIREDIGRHNALDKVIGYFFHQNALPLQKNILFLSGRVSFEMVQKAIMAKIPIIVAVGAPSSLAVALAQKYNITLIGFSRDQSFNIYVDDGRVVLD